ncbi:hypothetical protein DFQ29_006272 [Apophysomyces sp. BC1021]|nr:hypothetical protein DFQ29_006272 [Apophysomyces sp. BC1021]
MVNQFSSWFRTETEKSHLMEVVDMLLNLSIFIYIRATMPWSAFTNAESQLALSRLVMLAIAVLLFRQLPAIIGLHRVIPAIRNIREAFFTGWFGPIGVGAIFYLTVAVESISPNGGVSTYAKQVIEPIVYFMVACALDNL